MNKLVTTCLILAVLLGTAGIARADDPYVSISTTKDRLEFGMATFSDLEPSLVSVSGKALFPGILFSASASLTVKVDSNCLHGPILASISDLRHTRGQIIPCERVSVSAPTTNGYVSMAKPVIISNPETGPHDIDLDFRVERLLHDPAGKFSGNITFTIIPVSF